MDKIKINVPKGIRYLSDWEDFGFNLFSESRCIVDKQIPGCGYTEWAIRCQFNVIITSPRKMLLQNKFDQHEGEVFLVMNELEKDLGVDIDLYSRTKSEVSSNPEVTISDEEKLNFRNKLYVEIKDYLTNQSLLGKKSKILVTYDSYYIVKGILEELGRFDQFWTVVDEMQVVLSDSRFKSTTEIKFMEVLKDVERVQFVSATPILKQYLELLEDFNNLPYYELDWSAEDASRVKKPDLKVLTMMSVGEKLPEIIKKYQIGEYDTKYIPLEDGTIRTVVSDEAVFYVNSVKHIVSIIKKCSLQSDEVNILCADTPLNQKKIKSLGKGYSIGSVPLRGIKPKKYTFCTRTVYLGADFYSECAKSYIFSDSNIDCLAVDISQDLPQILGRQRLKENPWKNSATLYYRSTSDYNKMTEENFKKELEKKVKKSDSILSSWEHTPEQDKPAVAEVYEGYARDRHYKDNYIAVTNGVAVFNQYAYVSDIRAFDIQQKDYADRFTVFSEYSKLYGDTDDHSIIDFLESYITLSNPCKRLEQLCNFSIGNTKDRVEILLDQLRSDDVAKDLFIALGPERCKANGYNTTKCKNELGLVAFDHESLDARIKKEFKVSDRISNSDIKRRLQDIFNEFNYTRVAKSTTLSEWFELKPVSMTVNGKRLNGQYIVRCYI